MRTNGRGLEVISRTPARGNGKPSLLFVHGAFAGAWCWDEHFLPWFAERGYQAHALSLSGHNASRANGRTLHALGIADYVADVAEVASTFDRPPVLIGHSMGGFIIQRYLRDHPASGAVLMASVPPTGLLGPAFSIATTHPLLMWQIGMFQMFGMQRNSADLLHHALFSSDKPRHETDRYIPHIQQESMRATMDMYRPVPLLRSNPGSVPIKVLGGDSDKLIAPAHVMATAMFYGVPGRIHQGVGHGIMLDVKWERVARNILHWMDENGL